MSEKHGMTPGTTKDILHASDLEIINVTYERLNSKALDALDYQVHQDAWPEASQTPPQ